MGYLLLWVCHKCAIFFIAALYTVKPLTYWSNSHLWFQKPWRSCDVTVLCVIKARGANNLLSFRFVTQVPERNSSRWVHCLSWMIVYDWLNCCQILKLSVVITCVTVPVSQQSFLVAIEDNGNNFRIAFRETKPIHGSPVVSVTTGRAMQSWQLVQLSVY